MGKRNFHCIFLVCLIFHIRYIFILCVHSHTLLIMYLLKTKKPHADTQTSPTPRPAPPSHGVGAAAHQQFPGGGVWNLIGRCWSRMLYLRHICIRGESMHNQASRDIRKPKPPRSISITISKSVVVANIILQMENHEGSGPVGNLG